MQVFFTVVSFIFGLGIGSFLNVVILRLPEGESLNGRSHCPNCKHTLSAVELVPLFSFLWQRGKCKNCGKKISRRYATIELLTGLMFSLAFVVVSPLSPSDVLLLLRDWFIISVLLVVFVIDFEHYLILDKVVYFAVVVLLALNLLGDTLAHQALFSMHSSSLGGVFSAVVISGFFYLIWIISRGKWIGFGDVKFGLVLGLASVWPGGLFTLFAAFMLGAVFSLFLLASGKKSLSSRVPFGTFLSLGCLLSLFIGNYVIAWYLSLLGVG